MASSTTVQTPAIRTGVVHEYPESNDLKFRLTKHVARFAGDLSDENRAEAVRIHNIVMSKGFVGNVQVNITIFKAKKDKVQR